MKRNLFILSAGLIIILCLSFADNGFAQTDGTLTFTYTQSVPSGTSATKNVMAVWIEDGSGNFVKTKMRYWGGNTTDHLPSWSANSSQNITDANTGATRTASTSPTAFGSKTITWDGKGAMTGMTCADGTYNIMIESSYCNPQPANNQHWLLTSFSFTKGPSAVHLTPAGDANFSGITIDWVPTFTGIRENSSGSGINVFPTVSTGLVNVDFQQTNPGSVVRVVNSDGKEVYNEKIIQSGSNQKTIDLSNCANGVYFLSIENDKQNKKMEYKVVIAK